MRRQPFLPLKKAIEFFTLHSSLKCGVFYLYNAHLLEQTVGVSPAVHEVDHVAHVDAYAASELRVEPDVARKRVPVAVEGKTDELALAVEDR